MENRKEEMFDTSNFVRILDQVFKPEPSSHPEHFPELGTSNSSQGEKSSNNAHEQNLDFDPKYKPRTINNKLKDDFLDGMPDENFKEEASPLFVEHFHKSSIKCVNLSESNNTVTDSCSEEVGQKETHLSSDMNVKHINEENIEQKFSQFEYEKNERTRNADATPSTSGINYIIAIGKTNVQNVTVEGYKLSEEQTSPDDIRNTVTNKIPFTSSLNQHTRRRRNRSRNKLRRKNRSGAVLSTVPGDHFQSVLNDLEENIEASYEIASYKGVVGMPVSRKFITGKDQMNMSLLTCNRVDEDDTILDETMKQLHMSIKKCDAFLAKPSTSGINAVTETIDQKGTKTKKVNKAMPNKTMTEKEIKKRMIILANAIHTIDNILEREIKKKDRYARKGYKITTKILGGLQENIERNA